MSKEYLYDDICGWVHYLNHRKKAELSWSIEGSKYNTILYIDNHRVQSEYSQMLSVALDSLCRVNGYWK